MAQQNPTSTSAVQQQQPPRGNTLDNTRSVIGNHAQRKQTEEVATDCELDADYEDEELSLATENLSQRPPTPRKRVSGAMT